MDARPDEPRDEASHGDRVRRGGEHPAVAGDQHRDQSKVSAQGGREVSHGRGGLGGGWRGR